jgi:hypothetical protein
VSANQLLSLAVFLVMTVTAFKQLRPGEPPVRLFSLQSIPFAFLFWIALTAGAWIALAPTDIRNGRGFVLIGVVETLVALTASAYMIVCLVRRK